jgi:dihydroorotase
MSRRVTTPPELLILQDARVFDPGQRLDERADIVIESGVLTRIGPSAGGDLTRQTRARIVDGRGAWVLPGFIDLRAHLAEPGLEYKEDLTTGLAAAAAGGFTAVCCTPDTDPINDTRVVTEWLLRQAEAVSPVRLYPIAAATDKMRGEQLSEMAALKAAGAVAVGDANHCITASNVLRRVLEYAKNYDLPVFQHTDDPALSKNADMNEGAWSARLGLRGAPAVAEEAVLARDLLLAEYTGGIYHASHVSTARSVASMRDARARGAKVSCAVAVHNLAFSEERLADYDVNFKLVPPLRTAADVAGLLRGIEEGVVDAIVSDHRPHSSLEKDTEFQAAEAGAIGLSTCFGLVLGLVHAGRLSLKRAIEVLTSGPASVLGITAPGLRVDERADLVLVQPEAEWTPTRANLRSKSYNTPLLGQALKGKVTLTLARGRIALDDAAPPAPVR